MTSESRALAGLVAAAMISIHLMTKWTRTRRDPERDYTDQEKLERKRRMLERLYDFVEAGIEAEPEFVKL